jgi:nicotinamidase-related amidase
MSHRKAFVVDDMQNDYCHPNGPYSRHGLRGFPMASRSMRSFLPSRRSQSLPESASVIHLRMAWNVEVATIRSTSA